MSREVDLTVERGCTLKSGSIFSVNEVVPKNITYAQLMAGITAGTYTKKSLANKTYAGQVRNRADGTLITNLVITVANNEMSYSIPASVTKTWPNKADTLFYDVHETDSTDGSVIPKVKGKISVMPSITSED
jgi:hypothetical protein